MKYDSRQHNASTVGVKNRFCLLGGKIINYGLNGGSTPLLFIRKSWINQHIQGSENGLEDKIGFKTSTDA